MLNRFVAVWRSFKKGDVIGNTGNLVSKSVFFVDNKRVLTSKKELFRTLLESFANEFSGISLQTTWSSILLANFTESKK